MTIAQAFNLAFDRWKEKNKEENSTSGKCEVCKCGCRLAVESDNSEDTLANGDSYKQIEEPSSKYGIRENKQCSINYAETSQSPGFKFVKNQYIIIYCKCFKGNSCLRGGFLTLSISLLYYLGQPKSSDQVFSSYNIKIIVR